VDFYAAEHWCMQALIPSGKFIEGVSESGFTSLRLRHVKSCDKNILCILALPA